MTTQTSLSDAFLDLGPQVLNATVHTATLGRTLEDRHILYAVIDGAYDADAKLAIIDLNSGTVLRHIPLPGAPSSWASAASTDGSVYVGSNMNGHLYRYVPGNDSAIDLGEAVPGETYIFSVIAGPDGSMYGGTFPGARLFQYHPDSGITLIGDGPIQEGEQYIRSLVYDMKGNAVFAGVGARAHLVHYECDSGIMKEVLPEDARDQFVYSLNMESERLFVRLHPSHTLFVYAVNADNPFTVRLEPEAKLEGVDSLGVSDCYDGMVCYSNDGELFAYRIEEKMSVSLRVRVPFDAIKLLWFHLEDQASFPGKTLIGIGNHNGQTCVFKYNPITAALHMEIPAIEPSSTILSSMTKGPDGLIYTSGYLVGGNGAYDPQLQTISQLRGLGQAENIAVLEGIMYFGIYPGAKMYAYDPRLPWSIDQSGNNPRFLFALDAQDRPYALATGKGKLFIGTVPTYGTLGGMLAVYEPRTGKLEIHENPAGLLSLVTAVCHEGILYAGTSVWGGLGILPVETEAGLLVFDIATGKSDLHRLGISGLHEISALTIDRNGLIWGVAEGYLFTYDPSVRSITWRNLVFPEIMDYGKHYWRDAHLVTAKDGYLYGTIRLAGSFFRIDPASKQITVLDDTGAFLLCEDDAGCLYYSDAASRMKQYRPPFL
jgi:hypothetical protein